MPDQTTERDEWFAAGRREGLAVAAEMLELPAQTIRFAAGEMTAQEMRTVKAILKWRAAKIRSLIHER